jgi:predicted ATP-grasp superfamily ATP-dependent carboligase/glycosyltransferase involved in cell wall biosynthesis
MTNSAIKIAYIMSRFPKLTETFVLYEILAMEQLGHEVEIYPLLRERQNVMHPEAAQIVQRANYQPFLSWPIVAAQFYFLLRKPARYFGTLIALLRGTWGSFNFFLGALGIFPKTVYFAQCMAAEGVTHIHAHFASHPAAAAFVIHRLVGIPYSFTAHGSDLHRDRTMLREKVADAAFVVAISDYNRQLILAECGEEYANQTQVIHCGVDTDVFLPHSDSTSGRNSTSPLNILCVGTLHEVKGQIYLLDACRLLADNGVDFACHFVGDGPDRATLTRRASEAGLKERVHFHGQRTRDEIAQLLHKADIVVAPSVPTRDGRREGIPIVLMEAMASGLPVIASGISGIPELVEHGINGLLVPPRDVFALFQALELLTTPQLRKQFGHAGREKVREEFDLHKNARMLAQRFVETHNAHILSLATEEQKPYAVVIGLDTVTGLQTARILARHKVPVIGIAKDPGSHFCRTKVCERTLFANTANAELINTLISLGPELGQKAVLFPCSDLSVFMVSRWRSELDRWFHVVLPDHHVVEMLMDKLSFYAHAEKAALPIPRTFIVTNKSQVEKAAEELTFPCIMKPPMRTPAWEQHVRAKVFKLSSVEELLMAYERYSPWANELMVQEWIAGTDAELYSCNCYFDAQSRPLVTFVSRKLRQWPPEIGVSSLGEECRNDVVLQETIRLFKSVGYRGLGYVEMKRDVRTGKHFVIEANIGRPTGRSAIAEAGGVAMLYAAYCDTARRPLPANLGQKYVGAKWIYLRQDIRSALHYWRQGELSLMQWAQSWRGIKTDAVFSWSDPAPFWADIRRSIGLLLHRNRTKRATPPEIEAVQVANPTAS